MMQTELAFDVPDWAMSRHGARTWEWIHTPEGGKATNMFIRLALGCFKRGKQVGAKLIFERLRWHYEIATSQGDLYKLNNNFTAYVARFAEDRVPELRNYFKHRL